MRSSPVSVRYGLHWLLGLAAAYALVSIAAIALSPQLGSALLALTPAISGGFLLLITLAFALRTVRWCYLTSRLSSTVGWRAGAEIYIGGFPMTFTPGRVGEIWRAWALNKQYAGGYRRLLPLIFCDRLLDLNTLLLFVCLGVFTAVTAYRVPALITLMLVAPLLLLMLKPRWGRKLIKLCWNSSGKRWSRQFAAGLAVCRHIAAIVTPAVYFPALLLSLLAWSAEAYAIFYVAAQLSGSLSLTAAMTTLGLGNIAGVASFLPGGIGGQEATMIYLFQQSGNSIALAVAITGIARIGTIFYAALIGLPFFIKHSRLSAQSG